MVVGIIFVIMLNICNYYIFKPNNFFTVPRSISLSTTPQHPLYNEVRAILESETEKICLPATFMPFAKKTLDVHVFPLHWYEAKIVIYDDRFDQYHYPLGKDLAVKGHQALVQSNAYILLAKEEGVYIYERNPIYKLRD